MELKNSASDSCVCWEPDGTEGCSDAGTVRHCLRYGGDDCSDIGVSEEGWERRVRGRGFRDSTALSRALFFSRTPAATLGYCLYCKQEGSEGR